MAEITSRGPAPRASGDPPPERHPWTWRPGLTLIWRMTSSIKRGMAENRKRWFKKASTATSSAAFKTHGKMPPCARASRAKSRLGKRLVSGLRKMRRPAATRSSPSAFSLHGHPVRVSQRILDRNTHVWDAQLRHHRAITEFYHGMDDGFRMDDNVNLSGSDVEEPARLDDLQSLVHQRRRIDGNPAAHPPDWMLQSLFGTKESNRRRGVLRNGPPEAVRMMRLTSLGCPARRHW